MARKVLPYRKGSWFLVPLEGGGCALGLVARLDGRGTAFGYFFRPRLRSRSAIAAAQGRFVTREMGRRDAILLGKFRDEGLRKGGWKLLETGPPIEDEDWPLPPLFWMEDRSGKAFLRRYDEETLERISEEPCLPSLRKRYPPDTTMGHVAVEIILSHLIQE